MDGGRAGGDLDMRDRGKRRRRRDVLLRHRAMAAQPRQAPSRGSTPSSMNCWMKSGFAPSSEIDDYRRRAVSVMMVAIVVAIPWNCRSRRSTAVVVLIGVRRNCGASQRCGERYRRDPGEKSAFMSTWVPHVSCCATCAGLTWNDAGIIERGPRRACDASATCVRR